MSTMIPINNLSNAANNLSNATKPDDEIADEDLIDPATVIEPPPEMKTIIEKTVSFVVKNGIEFESKVRDSQRSNRKFDFLNPGHAFHNYYKQKYQICKYPKAAALAEKYKTTKALLHSSQQSLLGIDESKNNNNSKSNTNKKSSGVIAHKLTLKQKIMQQLLLKRKPKSEYIVERRFGTYNKFVVPLPTKRITAYEIDVIKLVAQFTAVHGKSFIRDLQRGEPENETFGFLSPMHPRFQYFQRLIDSYSNIIDEFDDYSRNKRNNKRSKNNSLQFNLDRDKIWYESIGYAEWTNIEKEKDAKYLANQENERRANALIDWQAFTVLDTIDFDDDDFTHLVPPGKTIEEIDAILESTIDVEADINDIGLLTHDMDMDMDMDISASDSDMEQEDSDTSKQLIVQPHMKVPQQVIPIEMEKEKTELHRKQIAKAKAKVGMKSTPMPAPKGVIVSSDLDVIPTEKMETEQDIELRLKLEKILNDSRNEQLENQQCPICNEYINIKHLSQHIRIELLDPKWKEQKESLKLKLSQTTLASNAQISENLIKFNKAQNPNKNVEIYENKSDIIPWNGHKDSITQQKKLKAAENELKKKQEQLLKKTVTDENKQSQLQPPPMPMPSSEHNKKKQQQQQPPPPPAPQYPPIPIPPQQYQRLNPMMNPHFRPHPPHPHMLPPHHPMHAHHRPPPFGMMPPPPPRHMQVRPPMHHMPQQTQQMQPPIKKMKLNNNIAMNVNQNQNQKQKQKQPNGLINEDEFLKQNGGIGKNFKIMVKVPKDDKKKQFSFNGQMLNFTMQLNQNISELKQRIHNVLALPMNKQKLRIQTNGIWVKDVNSFAFYNINGNSVLELSTRTRGGKKNK